MLAYAWSWFAWTVAIAATGTMVGTTAYYAGGFGPLVAALAVVALRGEGVRAWFVGLWRWRVSLRWYAFALLFPGLLVALTSATWLLLGHALEPDLLPQRLAVYLPTLLAMALIGGGNEEPGWRGLGLPVLQARYGPLGATLRLGIVWALWHLPLLGLNPGVTAGGLGPEFAATLVLLLLSISIHAFWYTWLINRTGSVLLCILLHASYNAANGTLLLLSEEALHGPAEALLLPIMTGWLAASVLALVIATRGRLGA